MRRSALPLAAWAAVAAGGCGGSGPALTPVTGTATLDGRPLAHKNVRFVPEPGTPGTGGGGNTGADGAYAVIAVRPGATRDTPGVPPGAYKVVVTEPMFPPANATAAPPAGDGAPAPAIGLPGVAPRKAVAALPAKYAKPETTPLRVEVPPNGGPIDLKLTTN